MLPADNQAQKACLQILQSDGLVVLPTDTVYGVAALADSEIALDRLFAAKGRSDGTPVALLRPRDPDWAALGIAPNDSLNRLAESFWPGALTILLKTERTWDVRLDGGRSLLGIRIPDCEWLLTLLAMIEAPLAVTSANLSGEPDIRDLGHLSAALTAHVQVVVDAGSLPGGIPSTVIDLSTGMPHLVREGAIPFHEIESVLQVED